MREPWGIAQDIRRKILPDAEKQIAYFEADRAGAQKIKDERQILINLVGQLVEVQNYGGYYDVLCHIKTPEGITHIMRLLISLWDVGTVFFTIYPQVFRHEKSSIYYKYIEPLSYCFSISFKILIITVYGFMKWYICKCLFCKVYLLDLSYNRNAKPMTGSNELRFNLTQIRG